jgi:hypothetical protein
MPGPPLTETAMTEPRSTPSDPGSSAQAGDAAHALPDRLSVDPRSPHFAADLLERGITILFNGKERFDVEEYCLSEGWIKVPSGKTVDRRGRPLLLKLKGHVQASLR